MDAIEKDLASHEKMVYQWAIDQKNETGKKKYNILVAGHTHIPVFNSIPVENLYDVIEQDIKSGKYIFFNDIFEKEPAARPGKVLGTADKFKLPGSLQEKMLQKLGAKRDMARKAKMLEAAAPRDPFYFNTGCGFHSKITCIEISAGKIYLRVLGFDENRKIDFNSFVKTADLKVYGN